MYVETTLNGIEWCLIVFGSECHISSPSLWHISRLWEPPCNYAWWEYASDSVQFFGLFHTSIHHAERFQMSHATHHTKVHARSQSQRVTRTHIGFTLLKPQSGCLSLNPGVEGSIPCHYDTSPGVLDQDTEPPIAPDAASSVGKRGNSVKHFEYQR